MKHFHSDRPPRHPIHIRCHFLEMIEMNVWVINASVKKYGARENRKSEMFAFSKEKSSPFFASYGKVLRPFKSEDLNRERIKDCHQRENGWFEEKKAEGS